ncbi:hypothetical protein COV04_03170 [Candidatus Uhrbacteria bacterium CG10_big_fil_rev_8_21_14_0_10_48_11]|uniref:Glycerophosphoryl diester phosphodiesterase membrane domain-containing protein n=1 Tax=Candidatus Uhrbacteria bacterium CG10_big_fil_rev_8_21_14_0_10_48_11 TaxID=1975037 RepID=A0A2M8LE82_9BACT|nr:MAG: hypothetical protein COV04_03170 [Candidatus Uhrbacteria bacterium CG10_big_fil_rev_8_21_14_0_10_48_11]
MKNITPVYRTVLQQALKLTKERKALWFWGLFAALLGDAGEYRFLSTAFTSAVSGAEPPSLLTFTAPPLSVLSGLWQATTTDPFSVFILLLLSAFGAGLVAFFVWLITVSVIGLIRGAAARNWKSQGLVAELNETVRESKKPFGAVLVTYFFGRTLLWLIVGLVTLFGTLVFVDFYLGLALFIVAFVVLVPVLFFVSFVVRFAIMAEVLKGKGIIESVEMAIHLVRKNWMVATELALLLVLINFIAGLLLLVFIYVGVLPFLVTASVFWQSNIAGWAVLLATLSVVGFLATVFVFGALLSTFQWAAWTVLFVYLQQRSRALPKIVRFLGRFISNRPVRLSGRS